MHKRDEDGRADTSRRTIISAAALAALLMCLGIVAGSTSKAADNPEAVAVEGIAVEVYIYAYPLVTVELTRRRVTNVVAPADTLEGAKAPMGQFARFRKYPDASYRDVTAPNADTLYTYAYLDVSKEPWVVSIPDMQGRYAVFSIFDAWTTVFANPGKRTTGTGAQTFAITGPDWSGTLPPGVKEYKSSIGIVLFNGKIYCTGTPEDYEQVHALQDNVTAVPLSSYGRPYTPVPGTIDPAVDMKTPVRNQVNAMEGGVFFKLFEGRCNECAVDGVVREGVDLHKAGSSAYKPLQSHRKSVITFEKGKPVFILEDADGTPWVMQAWGDLVDPTLTYDSLKTLGAKLKPPSGWSYRVKVLDQELTMQTPGGFAWILQDELGNTYDARTAPATSSRSRDLGAPAGAAIDRVMATRLRGEGGHRADNRRGAAGQQEQRVMGLLGTRS